MSPVSTKPSRVGERNRRWRRHSATPCAASECAASRRRPSFRRRRGRCRRMSTGKPARPSFDLERDAGLGRRIGVADAGLRKHCAQAVEDRLVGDFAGKPDITGRDRVDSRRHQRAAPMRGRARKMRHAVLAQPREMRRRPARRRSTEPARRRRERRGRKSASRRSGGCRRTCPTRADRRACAFRSAR